MKAHSYVNMIQPLVVIVVTKGGDYLAVDVLLFSYHAVRARLWMTLITSVAHRYIRRGYHFG